MSAFTRDQRRFICKGVSLNGARDALPQGKYPLLQNVRSYQEGIVQPRLGMTTLTNGALASGAIHSIARLNDGTPFAAVPFFRIFGAGAKILAGQNTFPQLDTGYSTNPLTLVATTPVQAPNPWMYVGDSTRQRKFDVNGHLSPIGVPPPLAAPTSVLGPLFAEFVFNSGTPPAFIAAGAAASAVIQIFRINTTISSIVYDIGATGNASVVPVSMAGIDLDAIVVFNGVEAVAVQQVTIAVAPTTIAAIIYDAGTSGLCTIQPAGSLGTGQLETPNIADYQARAGAFAIPRGTLGTPPIPDTVNNNRIRQVDFPVNSLVTLGGAAETVRILSVAVGRDGIQSFRCVTAGTHAAADSITGVAAFRVNTGGTFAAGQTLQATAFENTVTAPVTMPATPFTTGGIKSPPGWAPINNISLINGVATQPDDDLWLSIRLSNCTVVQAVRVYLDVDAVTNDYTQNYFFFEWRANDIIAAIQASNTNPTSTLAQARVTTVQQAQTSQAIPAPTPVRATAAQLTAATLAFNANSDPLALGNNQWIQLHAKISDLVHVGTDTSRTLANVAACEVVFQVAAGNAVIADYSSLFVTGGSNPDVGATGSPRVYTYRYRSSLTGARSNPAPAILGGVSPRRQSVALAGVQSAHPDIDLVDWFTIGGSLTHMTLIGTGANSATPVFTDNFSDSEISGNPTLEYDIFQPWPSGDKIRTGTCNVAGNALRRVSGDVFNTQWAPGSQIIINGQTCTLYAQPSGTLLFINENAGNATGATFTLPNPTTLGNQFFGLWGPVDGVLFACGDANNPGTLYWTFPNDPDRTSDAYSVLVCSGSERLQNGFVWDDRPYVWSTDNLYAIVPKGDGTYIGQLTQCGEGIWSPWAFCLSPEGIYFVTKHGIAITAGGSVAEYMTDADLFPIFPHDGNVGVAVNGFNPPDFSQSARLRLAWVNAWLYFDYLDTAAVPRTMTMRVSDRSWWPDLTTPGISLRNSEIGSVVFEDLLGGTDGTIYLPGGTSDNGTLIACALQMFIDQGDGRGQKLYRDVMLKGDLTGGLINVTLSLTDGTIPLNTTPIGGVNGLNEYLVNVIPELGAFGTNLFASLAWNPSVVGVPSLHLWDVAYQPGPELASSWLSGPTTFNLTGYLQVPYTLICYISNAPMTMSVIIDGVVFLYQLPSSNGVYKKFPQWLKAVKGLTYQMGFQSVTPFQLFDKDCEVWVQAWGKSGGYNVIRPF